MERAGVRRIKSGTYLFPLIQPYPSGEGFKACVDTYSQREKDGMRGVKCFFYSSIFNLYL